MKRLFATIGVGATLLAGGCSGDEQLPTGMNPAVQAAAKPVAGLKVTPSQLNFAGTGATATLNVSQFTGAVSAAVSTPACVSVTLKKEKNQSQFTVTATKAGNCTVTVTDGAGSVAVPVSVAGIQFGTTLASGLFHTCGLTANGAAYCWGFNGYGQLGDASTAGSVTANPTPVVVAGGISFASLSAGYTHTCGLTPAGAAYCWGGNFYGQLGNTTNSGVEFGKNPAPLPVGGNLTFTALEAGVDHTCGLTAQGVMYCWGKNFLGQLGTTTNNGSNAPNPTPTPVSGNLTFTDLAAGTGHTCGVAAGAVYCWGNNYKGQLGNSTGLGEENTALPTPTVVDGLFTVARVATGGSHNCALNESGAARCWGDNHFGQLQGSADEISSTPVVVHGGFLFASIGAGGGHSCGLTFLGELLCWGGNLLGQLGSSINFGTGDPSYTPTAVSGVSLVAIAIRSAHTCGLTSTGAAWCWGFNRYGQLGNATNNNTDTGVPTPTAVIGGLTFATQ